MEQITMIILGIALIIIAALLIMMQKSRLERDYQKMGADILAEKAALEERLQYKEMSLSEAKQEVDQKSAKSMNFVPAGRRTAKAGCGRREEYADTCSVGPGSCAK
jgi:hypothetical protein